MGSYSKCFDAFYRDAMSDHEGINYSKMAYAGSYLFDFITYDADLDDHFGKKMIEVIECILSDTTFKYQDQSTDHYYNFILMCNMPFLADKIEWEASIQSCWFEDKTEDKSYVIGNIEVPKGDIKVFLTQLLKWIKK